MDDFKFNPVVLGVAAVAVILAAILFANNRSLSGELEALKATRGALEKEAKAANERANVAQRAVEEAKAETDKVKAANEQVNHAVTQLRNQLEQVQIQSNTAREDFEKRLTAGAEDLHKAQAETQRLTDEMGKANAARDEAEKQMRAIKDAAEQQVRDVEARLQAELAKERASRDAGGTADGGTGDGATGGVPQASP